MAESAVSDRSTLVYLGDDAGADRIRSLVEPSGYDVCCEPNVRGLHDRLANERVEYVLCSYELHASDGIEVAETIGADHPDVPVVLLVRNGSESIAARAVGTNVAAYLTWEELSANPERLSETLNDLQPADPKRHPTDDEYRILVGHFPNGLVTRFDRDLRYTVVGGTGFQDLDIAASDLEGKRPDEVFPPGNAEVVERLYQRALDGESSVRELELQDRIFRVQILPITDDSGAIVGGMTVSQDVTDRREREHRLRRYETVVETIDDGISWIDDDRRFTFVNRPLADLLDQSPEAILGRPVEEVLRGTPSLSADTVDRISRAIENVLEGTVPEARLEVTVDGPDGPGYRDLRFVPLVSDGDVVGAVGVNRDITARKTREEALLESERKYRGLVDTAPDAIFLADAESGRILEANDAAGELIGRPPEDIAGMHQSALHPEEEADAYRELFDEHVEDGGTRRRLPDGRQIVVTDADGRRTPVAISARAIDIGGRRIIHGIFRDISDQIWFETALASLHEGTRELAYASDEQEIFRRIAVAAEDLSTLSFAIGYRFDEVDGQLVPAAGSPTGHPMAIDVDAIGPGDGPFWRAFHTEETVVLDAGETGPEAPGPIGAAVVVPLADHGILVVGDHDDVTIEPATTEIIQILATDAVKALSRTERERHLAKRDRELERKDRRLRRLSAAMDVLHGAIGVLRTGPTPQALEAAACEHLTAGDDIVGAWIARPGGRDDDLVPTAIAGDIEAYLEAANPSLADDCREPSAKAIRSGEPTAVTNTSRNFRDESWRRHALEAGLRSALGVPIEADGVQYGTLVVYAADPGVLGGEIRPVVQTTADVIAHGTRALHRRDALMSTRITELEFRLTESRSPLVQIAIRLESALAIEDVTLESADGAVATVVVDSPATGAIEQLVAGIAGIEGVRKRSGETDRVELELTLTEAALPTRLANTGLTLHRLTVEDGECRLAIGVPPSMALHQARSVVEHCSPDAELVAKRENVERDRALIGRREQWTAAGLTERQRQAIDLALRRGYFESPKAATGTDLAEEMGISASAFHEHLRAAERKLITLLVEDPDAQDSLAESENGRQPSHTKSTHRTGDPS